jgi:Mg-chelatase subunit ChlD
MMTHLQKLNSFARKNNGSISIILAMIFMVLLGGAGLALDTMRAYNSQATLQDDIDRTALFVGAQAFDTSPNFDAKAVAQAYLDGLDRQKQASIKAKIIEAQSIDGVFRATAKATVPATLMQLFGKDSIDVTATAQVAFGEQPVEIALVLDTTGSMTGSKIDALKDASRNLVDKVFESPNAAENVKVSIVPFAQYVNVGVGYRHESWISVPPDSTKTVNQCYETYPNAVSSNCRMENFTGYNDGVPYTYQAQVCDWDYGNPVTECNNYQVHEEWRGCAGSRSYPLNVRDENYATPIPGLMNTICGAEMLPLTNDKAAVANVVESLVATGETYIPAGLIWGWRALSPDDPFDQGLPYNHQVKGKPLKKIMVLMTDGANTLSKDPSSAYHLSNNATDANQLEAELCSNIKASGITIYTVAFDLNDAGAKAILRDCASSPANYYDAEGSGQLVAAFSDIASSFGKLRLTR